MTHDKIVELVSQLTLEEKAGLTSGKDNWFTKAVERMGIPAVRTSDGPHGLRTQAGEQIGFMEGASAPAVCFPTACCAAASFDRDLIYRMGEELGKEAQAYGVNVLLGPGVNIKRSPLCGRNFEYFSEDPLLAGELGAAYVQGVQSQGVGTSLKHFFANNQEYRRNDTSSELDERTMREIYLSAFETVVKKAQPWTVMASYNKINGIYSTANKEGITDILRNEWGFEGIVMSDWGATHDRVAAVAAGCDLTMPAEDTDDQIVAAVREGRLAESDLDACCVRLLELAFKSAENQKNGQEFDFEGGHTLAREIASESMVLLKNEGLLPLDKSAHVAFIGPFAEKPRYQGGGSSHITSSKVTGALEAAKAAGYDVKYAAGCESDGSPNEQLLAEAVAVAKAADAAVVFIGLTEAMETEGADRDHMDLAEGHNALVEAVCAANPNTVVVLHGGSPVVLPWAERPNAILNAYLGGQAVGEAVVDVLYGDVNPSGHLAESYPLRLEDSSSYLTWHGEGIHIPYAERLFVGYRYYESRKMPVRYPFGYGLSYTSFAYSDLKLDQTEIQEGTPVTASVTVTNTGKRAGKAVVQLYVAPERVEMMRPVRELKGFTKIKLQPGESKTVTFTLDERAFAYWNPQVHTWRTETGKFTVQIGENAHDIVLETNLHIKAEPVPPEGGYTLINTMEELTRNPKGYQFLDDNIEYLMRGYVNMGMAPAQMLDAVPGKIDLAAVDYLSKLAGSAGGSQTLMSQPLSILHAFLPDDKKAELGALLDELNAL